MEDLTMKLGLLMETAQAQQALGSAALERLQEQLGGLDAVVREEIRATLLEELAALAEESRRAAHALCHLQRLANVRAPLVGAVLAGLAAAVPLAAAWWFTPSGPEIAALRGRRDDLSANIARLHEQGGRVQLRRCGAAQRLCVRVDRAAPAYGEAADYRIVQGY
jgi:hypothetical protein